MPKINAHAWQMLGDMIRPPPPPPEHEVDELWEPDLNPTQKKAFDCEARFLLLWGPKGGAKCRTPDAMIYTADGLKRLGALKPVGASSGWNALNQSVLAFDGEKIVTSNATGFWVEEGNEAIRCELDNGAELTGSPRHPLWVCAQAPDKSHEMRYASLEEMEALTATGWRFWTPFVGHNRWTGETPCIVQTSIGAVTVTEDLAYAIGALVGDGSLNFEQPYHRSVLFTNNDPECVARVRKGLAEIRCELSQIRSGKSYEYVVLPATNIKPLIRALGLAHLSYSKFIPDVIVASPRRTAAAFLRGLFDTDGTVDMLGRASLVTVSEKLGRDVQDLLAAFGILAARRPMTTASGRPTWRITVKGEHANRFCDLIGFEISRKRNRIRIPIASKRCPHGYNHNRYGYPAPIRAVCRQAWRDAPISKARAVKGQYKSLCSFGSVPGRHKVRKIIDTFGSTEQFAPFLVSDNWLEVRSLTRCSAELYDLSVPGPTSFLASGTINHNSYGGVSKLVKHCYENHNALALILVRTQNMAKKGGAWDKLLTEVLPHWKEGMGLEFSDVKTDQQHYQYVWIENKFGGWCMVAVMSCPHAGQLRERARGMEPSIVFVDELTSCPSPEYFRAVAAQLGRRPGPTGIQQYIGACNPEGPSHWVYKEWFVNPFDEETGEHDPDFVEMFFPREENEYRMQAGYFEGLAKIYKHDAVESARMEEGEWVDRPSGESLFVDIFNVLIHVRPLTEDGRPHPDEWLRPDPKHAMIIGLDPGSIYNAFSFQQYMMVDGKMKWVIFDEIVTLRKRISYPSFVPCIMRRIRWWRDEVGAEMPQVWISDTSAFNQYRAAQGSFDVLELEKIYEANRIKYRLEPIKIKPCEKFNGSRVARTQLAQRMLSEDGVLVSSRCGSHLRMFNNLEGHKPKPGEMIDPEKLLTPIRSDHVHVFDAASYPWLKASLNPTALIPSAGHEQTLIRSAA